MAKKTATKTKSKPKTIKKAPKPVTYVKNAKRKVVAKAPKTPPRPADKKIELGGPFPVNTGKGATVLEVANKLVEYFNKGQEQKVWDELWDFAICSCEGFGAEMEWRGRPAVEGKNAVWAKEHEIVGARAEGPFIGATGFGVRYEIEVIEKSTNKKIRMTEVGVYTVQNGRIVREEFMYMMP